MKRDVWGQSTYCRKGKRGAGSIARKQIPCVDDNGVAMRGKSCDYFLRIKAVLAKALARFCPERAPAAFAAEDATTLPAMMAADEERES